MPMADARRQAPSPLNDLLAADARATEYGRASADEVLDGVRELLRGQRRLEQTMASLAQVPVGTPTPTEGTVKGTPSAAEGAEIWQMRSSYEQPWTPVTSGVPFQDSTCFGPLVGMGGFDSHTSENQLWLDRVEVREELVDCGSVEQLTRECSKESATLRLRSMRSPSSSNILVNFTDGSPRNQHPIRPRRWTMQHPTSPPRSIAELRHAVLKRLTWRRFSKCSVVSPASTARAWVDGLSLIVLGYNLSSIPYFLAFDVDEGSNPWVVLEGVSLVFWFVDMLMNFRTGYYEDGHLHMRPGRIARNYLRGSFFLDFFTLTVDIASHILRRFQNSGALPAAFIRMFKIGRVVRITGVMRARNLRVTLDRLGNSYHTVWVKALTGSLLNIGKFAAILVWINHTIACFWCFLGREDAVSDTGYTWMNLAGATGEGPTYSAYGVSYQYTTAFHWSLTQMTPGSMQVVPVNSVERIFNICCLMGGLMVFSTLVSAISASVAQLKIDMQGHSREMGRLSAFLHRSHIHPEIRMQVCKQVKVKLMHRRPLVVKDLQSPGVLDMLSLSLRHTLQLQLCNPHFLEHPLLNFCSNTDIAMWEEICMTCANFSVLVKGDNLFVFGAKAEGMYFVVHGPLSYDLDDSFRTRVSKEAETGAWLSEAALWCNWRHMGCAEAKSRKEVACCEVVLLKAATLIPILTRRGLIGQLAWAYARSFHLFLQRSRPPLCGWPNDLVLPFDADEVIASMPKDATAVIGQKAIEVLNSPPDSLSDAVGRWLKAVRQDNIQRLASEVQVGGSTLLVKESRALRGRRVVRCVQLVALRMHRQDGRVLVRIRVASKADGGQEATCKLPGCKQEAGEHPDICLQRLLDGKLRALADAIVVVGVRRESEQDNSRKFGVPTKYVRTVVSADWREVQGEPGLLGKFAVPVNDLVMGHVSSQSSQPNHSHELGFHFRRTKVEPKPPLPGDVFMLPGDTGFYAWLTEDQFDFFKGGTGQPSLFRWIQALYHAVGMDPARLDNWGEQATRSFAVDAARHLGAGGRGPSASSSEVVGEGSDEDGVGSLSVVSEEGGSVSAAAI